MKKPMEAIERMRSKSVVSESDWKELIAYLDSIPDDAIPVVWPKELTRERLEHLAHGPAEPHERDRALRAFAAIAPERKKRMVNLWMCEHIYPDPIGKPVDWVGEQELGWRKVAGPVEIDE